MAFPRELSCYILGVLIFSGFMCSQSGYSSTALIASLKYQFLLLYFWQEQESSGLNDVKC